MLEFLLEELTVEILLRLSKKDLARFKSVCKRWRDLINHRGFAERYREIAPPEFVTFHDEELYLLDVEGKNPIKKLDFPIDQSMIDESICVLHCDGTLCITLKNQSLLIWNPSSEQFKIVPNPDNINRDLTILGFGYDPVLNDYKIVTFIDRLESSTALVFHSRTGYWRETVQIPYPDWHYRDRKGTFLDKFLYWIAYRSNTDRFILCFNLTTHQYEKLPLPVDNSQSIICSWLGVINQKLCVTEYERYEKQIQISVMEKTGSWNKIITFSTSNLISVEDRSYDYEIDFVSFTKTNDLVVTFTGYYDNLKMKFIDRTMKKVFLYKIGNRTINEFQLCKSLVGIRFLNEYVDIPSILNPIFMD